ncbi:hypothetical protein [Microbispora sp. GKU 823]|uniref:hypothetical protein n=1 Tax=Microbispora sp. GKU 823 TaxID=1652100 RepID=UPI0015C42629|nr:hypothetical protein [Microbispora sp. GKU 823]
MPTAYSAVDMPASALVLACTAHWMLSSRARHEIRAAGRRSAADGRRRASHVARAAFRERPTSALRAERTSAVHRAGRAL